MSVSLDQARLFLLEEPDTRFAGRKAGEQNKILTPVALQLPEATRRGGTRAGAAKPPSPSLARCFVMPRTTADPRPRGKLVPSLQLTRSVGTHFAFGHSHGLRKTVHELVGLGSNSIHSTPRPELFDGEERKLFKRSRGEGREIG
jgi:hypothetical protein